MAKNKHLLGTPEELRKIQRVRQRLILGGTDRDDHVRIVDEWEKRVKKALITLNLNGHEGVKMLKRRAAREILDIEKVLKTQRPEGLTTESALQFAQETILLHERKRLWRWFLGLFVEAEEDLQDVMAEVALEFPGEDDSEEEKTEELDELAGEDDGEDLFVGKETPTGG